MEDMSQDEILSRCLKASSIAATDDEIAAIVRDAQVVKLQKQLDSNYIFVGFEFDHRGPKSYTNTELVYDERKADWFVFFDGSGQDDLYFIWEDQDGTEKALIQWP